MRIPNTFNQPVTSNRLASLPAASQIYLRVLWKWPWLLKTYSVESQRGREGGRSTFPGSQEVNLLLFKKEKEKEKTGVSSETPGCPCERATDGQPCRSTYDTRSVGAGSRRNSSKIDKFSLFAGLRKPWLEGKRELLVNNVSWDNSRTDMVNLTVCNRMKMGRRKTASVGRYE